MSDDMFARQEKAIARAKELNKQFVQVPCDDMTKFRIENCKKCPHPCPDEEKDEL